jgi:hypothetical protein
MINPYDWCVANKTIDDIKVSHVDPNIISRVLRLFDDE